MLVGGIWLEGSLTTVMGKMDLIHHCLINCGCSFYSDLIILAILPGALPRKGSTMED